VEPIVVEVVRAGVVEAVHRVHAVAVREGVDELVAGDPDRVAFLRSSAKPIQALPVARSCPELDDEQIVLCCASHLASPEQIAIVQRTLAGAGLGPEDLECGEEPTRLRHNCSGKHAGFLALCVANGWDVRGYRSAGHPCQEAMRHEVAAATGIPVAELSVGVDGCGVLTYAVSLRVAAGTFVRLRDLEGADRVIAAMQRRPALLRGPVAADAVLMTRLDGWVAKGGAEGLLCASSADGLGVALKVEDGAYRAIRPAFASVAMLLGIPTEGIADPVLRNSRGEEVGEIRVRGHAS
jgi:L-asparaginase II